MLGRDRGGVVQQRPVPLRHLVREGPADAEARGRYDVQHRHDVHEDQLGGVLRRELDARPAPVRTIIEAMALAASPLPVARLVEVAADLDVVEALPKALNDPTLIEVDRGEARLRSALLRAT